MSAQLLLIISIIGTLFAFTAGGVLTALCLAIASCRFSRISEKQFDALSKLDGAAKFCIENSNKIAPTMSLARKLFFALSALCAYLVFKSITDILNIEFNDLTYAFFALLTVGATLFLQYAIFDIPAAKWGRNHSICVLRRFAVFFYAFYLLFLPIQFSAQVLSKKIYTKKTKNMTSAFDYFDVSMMLRAEESDTDSISPYTGKIVKNAIRLQELDVSDVMLPRSQVVYLDLESSPRENIELAQKTRHTRYPLCNGDLDNCLGIVNIKNIFTSDTAPESVDLRKICRETMKLKENEKLESALAKMLKYRLHMALVEDEFGGVIGVITLDAPLSELVGKIRDEFDNGSDQSIHVCGKGKYKIQGLTSLHRVEDFLDVDFDNTDVSTFGGLITYRLGRFPEKGERLYLPKQRLKITIDDVDDKRVTECTVQMEDPEQLI